MCVSSEPNGESLTIYNSGNTGTGFSEIPYLLGEMPYSVLQAE